MDFFTISATTPIANFGQNGRSLLCLLVGWLSFRAFIISQNRSLVKGVFKKSLGFSIFFLDFVSVWLGSGSWSGAVSGVLRDYLRSAFFHMAYGKSALYPTIRNPLPAPYMHVCVCVCTHACTCVRAYACVYTPARACTCIMRVCAYAYAYTKAYRYLWSIV